MRQTSTCASVLNAGQSCTVSVTFTPTSAGVKGATLSLSSDAATNPVVTLSGTGAIVVPPTGFTDVTDTSGVAHASAQAHGMIYNTVQRQAVMLAFIDNFKMLGVVFFALIPVLLSMNVWPCNSIVIP